MKIPFTLDAWLKDKSQKVETRDGRTARIICTDAKADDGACIIALIPGYGGEEAYQFFPDGRAFSSKSSDEDCADLFLVTPEPELTDFETRVAEMLFNRQDEDNWPDCVLVSKEYAKELLDLARQEILKGENIMTVSGPGLFAEGETRFTNMPIADALKAEYEKGKAEALKDLPTWKRIMDNGKVDANGCRYTDSLCLIKQGWYRVLSEGTVVSGDAKYLSVAELEKLPGFKEDSHE